MRDENGLKKRLQDREVKKRERKQGGGGEMEVDTLGNREIGERVQEGKGRTERWEKRGGIFCTDRGGNT